MKKSFIFLLVFLCFYSIGFAQDTQIMSRYDRPTVSNVVITFADQSKQEEKVISAFAGLPVNPKYNLSAISFNTMETTLSRAEAYQGVNFEAGKNIKDRFRRFVADEAEFFEPTDKLGLSLAEVLKDKFNVGGEMMAEWATQNSNGNYTVLEQRSIYNLNAADIKTKVDYTKLEVFRKLLQNNFIILYDVQDEESSGKIETAGGRVGFNASGTQQWQKRTIIHAYIYKVDISDELFDTFLAPSFGKQSTIRDYKFPVKYVGHAAIKQDFDAKTQYDLGYMAGTIKKNGFLTGLMGNTDKGTDENGVRKSGTLYTGEDAIGKVSWEELDKHSQDVFTYNYIAKACSEEVINLAEKFLEEFKVKAPVSGTDPIRAPIGEREGLRADQRFRVYENVYKGGEVITQAVGVVRATNQVAENTSTLRESNEEFKETIFKQTYGGTIREDMYMMQENDYGVSLSIGTVIGYGGVEGLPKSIWHFRGSVNISRSINNILARNDLYGYQAHFGIGLGSTKNDFIDGRVNTFAIDFGLSKQLYLNPRFDIVPEMSFTINSFGVSSNESVDFSEEGYLFWNLGARLPIWVAEGFAIEPAIFLPIKLSSNVGENPASMVHFALRGRMDF